ncbi:uncharacterized protein FOMMEDRAFT_64617, partial [Fomitiporia mediterranea MF3/22]|uniref:uncharacterized protein n=1 Tax=Fomitiporia mediterranea (strain MF3/22) TaxID=694068 RepID=UPI00044087C8
TRDGTTQLLHSAQKCDMLRGVQIASGSSKNSLPYSKAAHRALIALQCAKYNRPFNFVRDKFYALKVDMLRPGIVLPSPDTVSDDIKTLYQGLSINVRNYFKVS